MTRVLEETELVRRHRLLELFLVHIMGFPLDEVDAEAEQVEHAISDTFVERLARGKARQG